MSQIVGTTQTAAVAAQWQTNLIPAAGTDRVHLIYVPLEIVNSGDAAVDMAGTYTYNGQSYQYLGEAVGENASLRAISVFGAKESVIAAAEAGSGGVTCTAKNGTTNCITTGGYSAISVTIQDVDQALDLTSFVYVAGLFDSRVAGEEFPHSVSVPVLSGDLVLISALLTQPDTVTWTGATEIIDETHSSTRVVTLASTVAGSDGTITPGVSADTGDSYATVLAAVVLRSASAANQPPTADDDTFSIFDNIQNGETVGTFTATDSDGNIVSYAIDNAALAIDNSGVITIADNTGITAGVDITATVTATDDDGATDTALITITVSEFTFAITAVDPIRLGEAFTATIDNSVDLSAASAVSATLNGVALNGMANITANTIDFDAPAGGLQFGASYDLIITADGVSSSVSSNQFLQPTGKQYVTLVSIDPTSKFANPPYSNNGGPDADNMGAGDQPYIDLVSSPDGYAVSITDTGIIDLVNASGATQNQTVSVAYLDAQDAYATSGTTVLTLEIPSVPDTTKPVITLLGASTIAHAHGTAYTDAGATASDNEDGDITANIVVTGSVDTNTIGSYPLSYDVTDAAGNVADTVTRIVNVTDQAAPTIAINGSASINLTQGDTYTEQGATWSDAIDGTGTAVVGGDTVDTSTPGTYIVTYDYTDAAGNVATQATRTVIVQAPVGLTQFLTPENLSLDVVGEPRTTIKLFTESGNRFKVTLTVDNEPVDLSVFNRLVLKLDATTSIDSDTDQGLDWSNGNGEIVLDIGGYLTGKGSIDTTLFAYRSGINTPHVLWHPSLVSKLRIEKIEP